MDSMQLALLCRELADNKKAENIQILDLRKLPGVTDFMVLCTGTSDPHLRAVEEEISRKLRDDHALKPHAIDGTRHSGWIVLDYLDVLVHVMKKDSRERYDLEGLWNDAPRVGAGVTVATAGSAPARKKAAKKKSAKAPVAEVVEAVETVEKSEMVEKPKKAPKAAKAAKKKAKSVSG
jgi:ribosome-associated protein